MKVLWQNIQGVRRVVLETLIVSISALIVYLAVYLISGKAEIAVAAFAAFAVATAEKYEVKYWKVLIVYVIEAFALFGAMKFAVPYLAIGILAALCLGIVFFFAESKMRLWLSVNAPPAPTFDEEREEVGCGIFRRSEVVVARSPASEPFRMRLHRRLYRLYVY